MEQQKFVDRKNVSGVLRELLITTHKENTQRCVLSFPTRDRSLCFDCCSRGRDKIKPSVEQAKVLFDFGEGEQHVVSQIATN